jgi:acyl-CoA synthetase (AMP-forming)/AMP-acid ligase II
VGPASTRANAPVEQAHTRALEAVHPLAELIRARAAADANRSFLEDARSERHLTFGNLAMEIHEFVGCLEDARIDEGSIVAIAVADPIDFCVAYLATISSGRWAAPLNPQAPELAVAADADRRGAVAMVEPPSNSTASDRFQIRRISRLRRDHRDQIRFSGSAGTSGVVLASSGTTGDRKLIPLQAAQLLHAARSVATHHRLVPEDRGFNPLPLHHVNAEVVGLLSQLVAGSCLVLDERFRRTGFWRLMERRRISWINAVPAILARVASIRPGESVPSGIRFARSASAPLPVATLHRFEDATGIPVVETYGMTEAAGQITANPIDGPRKLGTVGRPVGVELRVVLDRSATWATCPAAGTPERATNHAAERGTDRAADHGTDHPAERGTDHAAADQHVGRVEIRGASVVTAYGGGRDAERFDPEGWLDTGDLGYLDEDGYLTLVGRRDDVINRGGEKVFPREIEEVILADPAVDAIAVVPEHDEQLGAVPVAYVVVGTSDGPLGSAEVVRALERIDQSIRTSLPRARRPVALCAVVRLPTGVNGKISRKAIGACPPTPIFRFVPRAEAGVAGR